MENYQNFENKLIRGDSLQIIKTIPNGIIDMVLTDPPFGMEYQSNYRKERHEKIDNDSHLEWMPEFVKEIYRVSKENTSHFIFCSWHYLDVFKIQIQKYFSIKGLLVWVKNNWTAGDLEGSFGCKTEFVIHFTKGIKKMNGVRDHNVLAYPRVNAERHPTEKPVPLCKYLITKFTNEKELVFDPFAGVGTTGVACLQSNRNYFLIELDAKYYKEAKIRLGGKIETSLNKGNLF